MAHSSLDAQQRYQLNLTPAWQRWFGGEWEASIPAGAFRNALPTELLIEKSPEVIWPGFMLPDTLPIIGNEYGDWMCVRIQPNDELGELVHWYHGGGDWVPIGRSLAEALLHDVVDQFRPTGKQMLRGAAETVKLGQHADVLERFNQQACRDWFTRALCDPVIAADDASSASDLLAEIDRHLARGSYIDALRLLETNQLSADAVACDQIEYLLQAPLRAIADRRVADAARIDWTPDFVQFLFDPELAPAAVRRRVLEYQGRRNATWPVQDWPAAEAIALQVLQRRQDLGWAFDIAGWARQRVGQASRAANLYWDGRFASSFSDQSVRIRSHWSPAKFRKFGVARLYELQDHLTAEQQGDDYLQTLFLAAQRGTTEGIAEFWRGLGTQYMSQQRHADAYTCFYRAGWDVGVAKLSCYETLLADLAEAAQAAGWHARASVANTHLACLQKRLR